MVKKFLMVATVVASLVASGATETVNGITWTYRVSGSGVSVGGGSTSSPAVPRTTTGAITIPSTLGGRPMTSIGGAAFQNCRELTTVTIPSSVTSIGARAFGGCEGLMSVTIPSDVTSIGDRAFPGCGALKTVYVDPGDAERVESLIGGPDFDVTDVSFVERISAVTRIVTFDLGGHGTRTEDPSRIRAQSSDCGD